MTCCKHCPEEPIPPPVPREARRWTIGNYMTGETVDVVEILPTDEKLGPIEEWHVHTFSDGTLDEGAAHRSEECECPDRIYRTVKFRRVLGEWKP